MLAAYIAPGNFQSRPGYLQKYYYTIKFFKYAHWKNYTLIYGTFQCFVMGFWRPIVLVGKSYDVAAIHQYLAPFRGFGGT